MIAWVLVVALAFQLLPADEEITMNLSGIATWEDPAIYDTAMSQTYPGIENPDDWGNVEQMWAGGTVPLIHPMFKTIGTPWSIANGKQDAELRTYITELLRYQSLGIKMMVGPYPEMNGTWVRYGANPAYGKQMFINFVVMAEEMGLTEVLWVWAPNDIGRYDIVDYYPGDSYVDVIGGSVYNFADLHGKSWRSVDRLYDSYVGDVRSFTLKPIIITQTGSDPGDVRTHQWIQDMFTYVAMSSDVDGFIYFDITEFELTPALAATFHDELTTTTNTFPWEHYKQEAPVNLPIDDTGCNLPRLGLYTGYGLTNGDRRVKALQIMLGHEGYVDLRTTDDTCGADGKQGPGTTQALNRYQHDNGFIVTEFVSVQVWERLYSS